MSRNVATSNTNKPINQELVCERSCLSYIKQTQYCTLSLNCSLYCSRSHPETPSEGEISLCRLLEIVALRQDLSGSDLFLSFFKRKFE